MPADANVTGDVFGGWIMAQVDIAGSIPCFRLAKGRIATVAVNSFVFKQPVFIGDLVSAHLICTVNSEARELDEAVLRPGRQKFFHEFDLLHWDQARRLAERLGTTLTDHRSYSLAEIYHFRDLNSGDRLDSPRPRPIGFSAA